MKNTFKKLVMLVLALSMIFTLCACGGDSSATNGSESNKGSESDKNSQVVGESETEKEVKIRVSECFNKENQIWYQTDGTGKDAEIESVLIYKNGKLYRYGGFIDDGFFWDEEKLTLGDVAKLSDEEAIEKVENMVYSVLKETIEAEKAAGDTIFSQITSGQENYVITLNDIKYVMPVSILQKYYDSLDSYLSLDMFVVNAKFALYTDETGNDIAYETLKFYGDRITSVSSFFRELGKGYVSDGKWEPVGEFDEEYANYREYTLQKIRESSIYKYSSEGAMYGHTMIQGGTYEVYDSTYGGFEWGAKGMGYYYLLTRADKNVSFKLDLMGTEGVEIDPEEEPEEEIGTEEW